MKFFVIIAAIGIILIQSVCSEIIHDDFVQRKNETNQYLQQYPVPSIIEINKDNDWLPWKSSFRHILQEEEEEEDDGCRGGGSSLDEFPTDLFTQEQRLQGAVVLHFIGFVYIVTCTGILINNFYLPTIQCICDALNITPDVGAAVFMSTATCVPELFTNLIGTFVAESDMGLGAVIGSLMFNMVGCAACASFATRKPAQMDWVPITRDCAVFAANIIVLIGTTWDGYIHWYEALIIMSFAIPYYLIMFQSTRISLFMKRKFEVEYGCCDRNTSYARAEAIDLEKSAKDNEAFKGSVTTVDQISMVAEKPQLDEKAIAEDKKKAAEEREAYILLKKQRAGLWPCPKDTRVRTIFWYYTWPIRAIFTITIPNPKTHRKWFPLSFIMCIIWIGFNTYMIFFMMIVIAHTFSIPEPVMGITVFAIGGCSPEIITNILMARRGNSNVGVSNSIGASSLAIIVSLAVPWLFRALIITEGHENRFVELHTNGMEYVILSLLLLVFCFYLILLFRRFILTKITGAMLLSLYGVFITIAVLMEIGIFFGRVCL